MSESQITEHPMVRDYRRSRDYYKQLYQELQNEYFAQTRWINEAKDLLLRIAPQVNEPDHTATLIEIDQLLQQTLDR